jgi:cathepsin L
MYTKTVVFLAIVALGAALPLVDEDQVARDQFTQYKTLFNKVYDSEEEEVVRLAIFKQNLEFIAEHNARYEAGEITFEVGVNQFADMNSEEYKRWLGPSITREQIQMNDSTTYLSPTGLDPLPPSVDWFKQGYVTPVKDQKQCGSCWSFSTTGTLEGQTFKKTSKLVSLSEQNLVDCSTHKYNNNGCRGGWPARAMKYIKDNNGIDTEESYPYTAHQNPECKYDAANIGATLTGSVELPQGNEARLQEAVATIGPISVAIDANHMSFQLYKQGVYVEPRCSLRLDHAVLVTGYGTDAKGGDYWIVKNSWNTVWGDKGYIKMARNKKNQCGIAEAGAYPLV